MTPTMVRRQKDEKPKRIGLIVWAVIGMLGGLGFFITGLCVLAIHEEQINIPVYAPNDGITRQIEPDIWVEYSESPNASLSKPWYYLACHTISISEDQYTWYIYVSRPLWWWPVPGGQRQGDFYTTIWGKNFLFGGFALLTGIIDLIGWAAILIKRNP